MDLRGWLRSGISWWGSGLRRLRFFPQSHPELWRTREASVRALAGRLKIQSDYLEEAFTLVDELLDVYQQNIGRSEFLDVCGAATTKGRNLALGLFSLCLDGLAQEGGALLRPLVECIEKLEYFWKDPERAKEATLAQMPSAGTIAGKIESPYRNLREYLNDHASHFGFGYDSVKHLVDWTVPTWRKQQPFVVEKMKVNLRMVFAFVASLTIQSASCLSVAGVGDETLYSRIESLRDDGLSIVFYTGDGPHEVDRMDLLHRASCNMRN